MRTKSQLILPLLLFFAAIGFAHKVIVDPWGTLFLFVFAALVIFLLYKVLSRPYSFQKPPVTHYRPGKKREYRKKRPQFRVIPGKKDSQVKDSENKYYH